MYLKKSEQCHQTDTTYIFCWATFHWQCLIFKAKFMFICNLNNACCIDIQWLLILLDNYFPAASRLYSITIFILRILKSSNWFQCICVLVFMHLKGYKRFYCWFWNRWRFTQQSYRNSSRGWPVESQIRIS